MGNSARPIKLIQKDQKRKQVRAPRFEELSTIYNIKMRHLNAELDVVNISDSGIKINCGDQEFAANEILDIHLFSNNGAALYSGPGRVAWVRTSNGKIQAGIEFRSQLLPKGFLKSLDRLLALEMELTDSLEDFESLPESFRSLVFEIKNFLSHLKTKADKLEESLVIESEETKSSLVKCFDVRFGEYVQKKLMVYSGRLFDYFKSLTNKREKALHYDFFRRELNSFYLASPYARRAFEKPQGYAGDYEMMNQVYRNSYEGTSLFAKLIHKYSVNEPAARSVRERRGFLKEKISDFLLEQNGKVKNLEICSVACGPALEIVDLIADLPELKFESINFTLVDQDIESLLDARRGIHNAVFSQEISIGVNCVPVSVKSILEKKADASEFFEGNFDFIYTAGLYDYLLDPIANLLTQNLFSALNPGGHLLIGNFHPDNPTRAICEFSTDWQLIYRDEKDMEKLGKAVESKDKVMEKDSQGFVVYLDILK